MEDNKTIEPEKLVYDPQSKTWMTQKALDNLNKLREDIKNGKENSVR